MSGMAHWGLRWAQTVHVVVVHVNSDPSDAVFRDIPVICRVSDGHWLISFGIWWWCFLLSGVLFLIFGHNLFPFPCVAFVEVVVDRVLCSGCELHQTLVLLCVW